MATPKLSAAARHALTEICDRRLLAGQGCWDTLLRHGLVEPRGIWAAPTAAGLAVHAAQPCACGISAAHDGKGTRTATGLPRRIVAAIVEKLPDIAQWAEFSSTNPIGAKSLAAIYLMCEEQLAVADRLPADDAAALRNFADTGTWRD